MTVFYAFDDERGFLAFDANTGYGGYAYPSSPMALAARKAPSRVADELVQPQVKRQPGEMDRHIFMRLTSLINRRPRPASDKE